MFVFVYKYFLLLSVRRGALFVFLPSDRFSDAISIESMLLCGLDVADTWPSSELGAWTWDLGIGNSFACVCVFRVSVFRLGLIVVRFWQSEK